MKNNRKNRKLKFIRAKNNLRLGKAKFYCDDRVGNFFIEDKNYWEFLIKEAFKSLLKTYKLKLRRIEIVKGLVRDDFIKDLHTNRIALSN